MRETFSLKLYRTGRYETLWLVVTDDDAPVGYVTKIRDTRLDSHPWKCFLGTGEESRFIGVTYQGREMALKVVAGAWTVEQRRLRDEATCVLGLSERDLDRVMPSTRY